MSKLLKLLEASTSMGIASNLAGYQTRKRRRKSRTSMDLLYSAASGHEQLQEGIEYVFRNASSLSENSPMWMEVCKRSDSILESLELGRVDESLTKLDQLCRYLGKSLQENAGLTGPAVDPAFSEEHTKFIDGIAEEFGIEIQSVDMVGEGVYAYIDATNTNVLADCLSDLRKFCEENAYVMVKKGTMDDIYSGPSGCCSSTWVFILDAYNNQEEFDATIERGDDQ